MQSAKALLIGFLPAVLTVLCAFAEATRAEASVSEDPQELVVRTINELVNHLQEHSERIHQDTSIAYRISDELVKPYIDFPRITRLVIGKHWKTASEQQREALIAEIQALLIRSYVTAMSIYADQIVAMRDRISYLPSCYKSGDKKAAVRASITLDNGQAVEVTYRLYNGAGTWLIYDIVIEGISLAMTYRASFSEQIKRDGVNGLIVNLAERNRRGEVEVPPSTVIERTAGKNAP